MKKAIITVALILCAAFIWTACGGVQATGTGTASASGDGAKAAGGAEKKDLPMVLAMDGQGPDKIEAAKDSYNKAIQKILMDFLGATAFNNNKAKLQGVFWDENPMTLKSKQFFTRKILGSSESGATITVSQELTVKTNKIRAELKKLESSLGGGSATAAASAPVIPPPTSENSEPKLDTTVTEELPKEDLSKALTGVTFAVGVKESPQLTDHASKIIVGTINQKLLEVGAEVVDESVNKSVAEKFMKVTAEVQGGTTKLQELADEIPVDIYIEISGVVQTESVAAGRMFKATGELTYKAFDQSTARFIAHDMGQTYVGAQTEDIAISGLGDAINRRVMHTLINKIARAKMRPEKLRVNMIGLSDLDYQKDFENALDSNPGIQNRKIVRQVEESVEYDVYFGGKQEDFIEWVLDELHYVAGFEDLKIKLIQGNNITFSLE